VDPDNCDSQIKTPDFDGALFPQAWRDALWDKFCTAPPRRLRQFVEQYKNNQESLRRLSKRYDIRHTMHATPTAGMFKSRSQRAIAYLCTQIAIVCLC
jgi:hypothetical protein